MNCGVFEPSPHDVPQPWEKSHVPLYSPPAPRVKQLQHVVHFQGCKSIQTGVANVTCTHTYLTGIDLPRLRRNACAELNRRHPAVQFTACGLYQYKSMWRYVTVVPIATAAGSPDGHDLFSSIFHEAATSIAHGQPVAHSVAVLPEYFQSEAEKVNYSQGRVRPGPAPA